MQSWAGMYAHTYIQKDMVSDKKEVDARLLYIHTYVHTYMHANIHTYRLQKDMVSDKEEVKAAAEIALKELVAMAMGEAIKAHHT